MTVRATKRAMGRVTRKGAADLLLKTGRALRDEGVISGFQINASGSEWVTAAYKIAERPRQVEVRISPKFGDGMLGVLVATLIDENGDYVAGISGPTKVGSNFLPRDLKDTLVNSLLQHSVGNAATLTETRTDAPWRGVFLAALDAREKAEVVYAMVRNGKKRKTARGRNLNRKLMLPLPIAS